MLLITATTKNSTFTSAGKVEEHFSYMAKYRISLFLTCMNVYDWGRMQEKHWKLDNMLSVWQPNNKFCRYFEGELLHVRIFHGRWYWWVFIFLHAWKNNKKNIIFSADFLLHGKCSFCFKREFCAHAYWMLAAFWILPLLWLKIPEWVFLYCINDFFLDFFPC